jgi:hypothetical protein
MDFRIFINEIDKFFCPYFIYFALWTVSSKMPDFVTEETFAVFSFALWANFFFYCICSSPSAKFLSSKERPLLVSFITLALEESILQMSPAMAFLCTSLSLSSVVVCSLWFTTEERSSCWSQHLVMSEFSLNLLAFCNTILSKHRFAKQCCAHAPMVSQVTSVGSPPRFL